MVVPLVFPAPMTMWTHYIESLRPLEPAHASDIAGQLHNMAAWDEYAQLFYGLLVDRSGAMLHLSADQKFQQALQITTAMGVAASSTLDTVRKADMFTMIWCTVQSNAELARELRMCGMSDRAIARVLAVRLGLPLTPDAFAPLTPPLSPTVGHGGTANGVGAVLYGSAMDEALIELTEHFVNALLISDTDLVKLVALVRASAELCSIQAVLCWMRVEEAVAQANAVSGMSHVNGVSVMP